MRKEGIIQWFKSETVLTIWRRVRRMIRQVLPFIQFVAALFTIAVATKTFGWW
jgi:hypothetical protein